MKKAFDELKLYLQRKTEENNSISLLTHIKGINQRQAQIIKIVQAKPNSCVKEIENRFSVGNQTARTDLYSLVELGYLTEIQINKRKVAFVKSNEFDAKLNSFSGLITN
ncbi:hypothetical protein FACS1894160_4400 [Bacteroidia bacterium]|nr:hypothetical protein FACS1894160_4400 [Bacteroidia bacterium]